MGLFIRDDTVRDLARRLAEARRTTVTEAVRRAIERDLAEMQQDVQERERRLDAALARLDALPRRKSPPTMISTTTRVTRYCDPGR
jgi:hypothetical protein